MKMQNSEHATYLNEKPIYGQTKAGRFWFIFFTCFGYERGKACLFHKRRKGCTCQLLWEWLLGLLSAREPASTICNILWFYYCYCSIIAIGLRYDSVQLNIYLYIGHIFYFSFLPGKYFEIHNIIYGLLWAKCTHKSWFYKSETFTGVLVP